MRVSTRNKQITIAVVVNDCKLKAVADSYSITVPRVRQIVIRTLHWVVPADSFLYSKRSDISYMRSYPNRIYEMLQFCDCSDKVKNISERIEKIWNDVNNKEEELWSESALQISVWDAIR